MSLASFINKLTNSYVTCFVFVTLGMMMFWGRLAWSTQVHWVVVENPPAPGGGFLGLPDDSKPGPILRCVSGWCASLNVVCTTRVGPDKPEIWANKSTRELAQDKALAAGGVYAWVQDDIVRLLALRQEPQPPVPVPRGFETKFVETGGGGIILADTKWDHVPIDGMLSVGALVYQNRLDSAVCFAERGEQGSADSALVDFVADFLK